MLQQTRAAAVVPYYERFLKRFPTVKALARSREASVLRSWSGLGYYSRARNLRRAARQIVAQGAGRLPASYLDWVELPGVGPYTAAAVASIANNAPVAVLDGNVARVMARLANHRGDIRSPGVREELRRRAEALLDRRHPGDFNQALMELGATICLPRNPRCPQCPVLGFCEARRLGLEDELPVRLRPPRPIALRVSVALARRDGRFLVRRRPHDASLMPGFWEFPQFEGTPPPPYLRFAEPLGQFRHAITNHQYTVTVSAATLHGRPPADHQWIPENRLPALPLTTISRKALHSITKSPNH